MSLSLSSVYNCKETSEEGSRMAERTTTGWAVRDSSGVLAPLTYPLRKTGEEDVYIKVLYCGVCHTDLHHAKNDFGLTNYPMVPGHEIVGQVLEVGSNVSKYGSGEIVGVGYIVDCCRQCKPCKSEEEQYCKKKILTFNDVNLDGTPTRGGFSHHMVVDQKFVVKIPEGMTGDQAAPLLCAGVTIYSPLSNFGLKKSGLRGGIAGLGGLGHMGVKIAKALGHHVTVISSSEKKRKEAMEELEADDYLVSSDLTRLKELAESLDYIIDTVPAFHQIHPLLSLLAHDGKLILIGVVGKPLEFYSPNLISERRSIAGSLVGSMKEAEEMLELCNEKGVSSMVEVIKLDYINTALERLEKNDVRYRFVIDVAGSSTVANESDTVAK